MKITDILLRNFFTISLIIGMGFIAIFNTTFTKRINRYFIAFIMVVTILLVADMGSVYLSGFDRVLPFRHLTSSIGYTLRPATLAIIICILLRWNRLNLVIWIPVALTALVAFTSPYTHLMFWFNAQNHFMRGPLGFMPHIVSGLYMLAIVVITIRIHKYVDRGELYTIYYIATICAFATVMESVAGEKFLLPGAMMVSCVLYYVFLYVQTNKRDELTGVLNRRSFYNDTEKMLTDSFVVISMDLNGLKDINDTYGHQAGDTALKAFSYAVVHVAADAYRVYRIGGDEFFACGRNRSLEDAGAFAQQVRDELSDTGYMASFGCAVYTPGADFRTVCNLADQRMYEDKSRYKNRNASSRKNAGEPEDN